ncbi:hypothetical protein Bbelb_255750 [Branchiostoma belcheri]|nr:hypothetical protein Bbelb_255750 [Branchiostoma belcheri]
MQKSSHDYDIRTAKQNHLTTIATIVVEDDLTESSAPQPALTSKPSSLENNLATSKRQKQSTVTDNHTVWVASQSYTKVVVEEHYFYTTRSRRVGQQRHTASPNDPHSCTDAKALSSKELLMYPTAG